MSWNAAWQRCSSITSDTVSLHTARRACKFSSQSYMPARTKSHCSMVPLDGTWSLSSSVDLTSRSGPRLSHTDMVSTGRPDMRASNCHTGLSCMVSETKAGNNLPWYSNVEKATCHNLKMLRTACPPTKWQRAFVSNDDCSLPIFPCKHCPPEWVHLLVLIMVLKQCPPTVGGHWTVSKNRVQKRTLKTISKHTCFECKIYKTFTSKYGPGLGAAFWSWVWSWNKTLHRNTNTSIYNFRPCEMLSAARVCWYLWKCM